MCGYMHTYVYSIRKWPVASVCIAVHVLCQFAVEVCFDIALICLCLAQEYWERFLPIQNLLFVDEYEAFRCKLRSGSRKEELKVELQDSLCMFSSLCVSLHVFDASGMFAECSLAAV